MSFHVPCFRTLPYKGCHIESCRSPKVSGEAKKYSQWLWQGFGCGEEVERLPHHKQPPSPADHQRLPQIQAVEVRTMSREDPPSSCFLCPLCLLRCNKCSNLNTWLDQMPQVTVCPHPWFPSWSQDNTWLSPRQTSQNSAPFTKTTFRPPLHGLLVPVGRRPGTRPWPAQRRLSTGHSCWGGLSSIHISKKKFQEEKNLPSPLTYCLKSLPKASTKMK